MKKIKKVFHRIGVFCISSLILISCLMFCVGAVMCIVELINDKAPNLYEALSFGGAAIVCGFVGVILESEDDNHDKTV